MKKLFTVAFLAMIACSFMPIVAKAQVSFTTALKARRTNLALDSLAKDSTRYLIVSTALPEQLRATTVYLDVLKISGTVSGGITVEGSHDNSKWYTITTDTLVNASKNYRYTVAPKADKFIRIKLVAGTGTQSSSHGGTVYGVKP